MNKIKCIVVDDEELARDLITAYIKKVDFLECIGNFENALDALPLIKSSKVDLLFLDIQMPDIKGTDFSQLINTRDTRIIFTTAYSEYALEGYELNALDYLVKPISFKRFLTAIEKLPIKSSETTDHIIIKSGYDLHKILYSDIIYAESDSEYVIYHTTDGKKLMANQSLTKLEKSLPPSQFMRVHRSYIINKKFVTGLKSRDLSLGKVQIPISDSYFEKVKKELFS